MLLSWSKVHKLCSTLSIILLISLFEKQSKWKGPFGLSYAQLSSVAFLLIFSYAPNLCVVTQCSSPEVCGITKNSCKGDYPSVGHLIVHLWHDTEVVCYSQKFSEKSWRLESKWNTIFLGCRVKCHTCTCTSPPPKPRGRRGEGPHGLWGEDVWHFKLCGSLPWKISRSNGTSEKLLLFFRTESS